MRQPANVIAGRALVRLHTGSDYVGDATYDGQTVTIDGKLRVVSLVGGRRTITYRAPRRRTFDVKLVRRIDWQ